MIRNLTVALIILFIAQQSIAQRGSLGDLTISVQNEWVNTYTYLTNNANAGASSISVNSNALGGAMFTNNLAAGDLVLIIQMQGASVDVNTTPTVSWGGNYTAQNSFFSNGNIFDEKEFGQVTNYNNAGNYEYAEVRGVSGSNTILLNCALTSSYTAAGHVQVIRVPRFDNLSVQNNASISCPLWSGQTGGVLAIEVNGNLTLNGSGAINSNETGFRGGQTLNISTNAGGPGGGGFLGSYDAAEGAEKGEGIGGYHDEYDLLESRYCRGAIANGGGGANYHNAGGGGGSNVGTGTYHAYGVPDAGGANQFLSAWNLENASMVSQPSSGGGRGGYSHANSAQNPLTQAPNTTQWSGDFRRYAHGHGGHPLTYSVDRVFAGGGGGAGDENDGDGGDGGRGGGIVLLPVYGDIIGTGSINANGGDGGNAEGATPPAFTTQKSGDDGAGGGGGGGSIVIQNSNPLPSSVSLNARGGDGGNQILQLSNFAANTMDGPGGGGAGGLISTSGGAAVLDISGGVAGTSSSSIANNFPANGATSGASGVSNQLTSAYDLTVLDQTICGGGSANLSVTVLGSLPAGGSIEWYTSQFGGSSLNSGTTYTTPVLGANTTYWVGVCPGTFRIPFNVFVSPAITITGTAVEQDETCAGNDASITGLSASGGFGALTFDWNGVVSTSEDLTGAIGGTYNLTVIDENGCTATSGPYILTASPGPSMDVSNMVIDDETCFGNDGSITGIVATGSNLTFAWNGNSSAGEDLNGVTGGTYTLVVTDDNSCQATAGPFTVNTISGPVIDISGLSVQDESCFGNDGEISGIVVTGSSVTYQWNGNVSASSDLTNANAGAYTLVATDDNGCSTSEGPITVGTIAPPTIDITNLVIQGENCNQFDGAITGITASGIGLTFEWNEVTSVDEDLVNQQAGSYTLVVTDNLGCTAQSGPHEIPVVGGPAVDDANLIVQDETCNANDGAITGLTATGSGLVFVWNGTPGTLDLQNITAGSYNLTVIDGNGCSADYGPIDILEIPPPTIDDVNLTVLDESCVGNDGVIQGLVVTGNGLTYTWNSTSSPSQDAAGLSAGDYTLEVIDENGCNVSYGPITVGGTVAPVIDVVPGNPTIDLGDNVGLTLLINPSSASDAITWTPSAGLSCTDCINPVASPTQTTTYVVTVSNADGCVVTDTVLIAVTNPCGEIFVPTIFTPNGDNHHDELCVLGGCVSSITFEVFNRWGERVFKTENPEVCWDGLFKGKKVNTGVFVYKAKGTRTDGTTFEAAGNVTIVH